MTMREFKIKKINKIMLNCIRSFGLALLLFVGAGSASFADISKFEIDRDLNNFRFNAIKSIPNGPYPDVSKVPCAWFSVPTDDQKFSISRSIQNKGWGILSEVRLANTILLPLQDLLMEVLVEHVIFHRAI